MASSQEVNIPQKPPMVMVDRLLEPDGPVTRTSFRIAPDNLFCSDGFFSEPGLIENMAQTAAAGTGARPGHAGEEPPTGFIGGIRDLVILELPPAGSEIITQVTVLHEVFDATVVRGEVFLGDRMIASCEMNIFLIKP